VSLFDISDISKAQQSKDKTDIWSKKNLATGTHIAPLEEAIPKMEKDVHMHCWSMGTWSAHQVAQHLINLIGPVHASFTSWTVSEEPIKTLIKLKEAKQFLSFQFICDPRVKTMAMAGYPLLKQNFENVHLKPIHAKIMLLGNDDFKVIVHASANWTLNRRTEYYAITESEQLYDFNINKLNQLIHGR
tara:strand:- start:102 stop:665 length:564 start_codon:yes stop_codon:yes gene_type:complete